MPIMTAPTPSQDLIIKATVIKATNHLQTVLTDLRVSKRALVSVSDSNIDLEPDDQYDGSPCTLLMISTNSPVDVQIQTGAQTLNLTVSSMLVLDQPIDDFLITTTTSARLRIISCK